MTDDLERRLRAAMNEDLPASPVSLRSTIPTIVFQGRARRPRPWSLLVATLALFLIVAVALSAGTSPPPDPVPTQPPGPTTTPPASARSDDAVMTITELAQARLTGTIVDEVVSVRGYWTDASSAIDCGEPEVELAELEAALIGCDPANARGLTEYREPLWRDGTPPSTGLARGPSLRPHVDPDVLTRLRDAVATNGDVEAPTPMVVTGHFDDPRAEACRSFTREHCRERFVLDDVLAVGDDATPRPSAPSEDPAIWTVGQLVGARIEGRLDGRSVMVRGFWTDLHLVHSCAPGVVEPSALEWDRCSIGERGMTELAEPIGRLTVDYRLFPPAGPSIGPLLEQSSLEELYTEMTAIAPGWWERATLWPIVVEGHFDDPRAADCTVFSVQDCRDRFVVTRVVRLDPPQEPIGRPTAPPSAFPFDSPPPPPFTADRCFGDIEYSFVGWGRLPDVGVVDFDPGVVYMMVTAEPQDLGRGRFHRRVCYAREYDLSGVGFATIP